MPRHLQRVKGGHTKDEMQTFFKYVQGCYVFNVRYVPNKSTKVGVEILVETKIVAACVLNY